MNKRQAWMICPGYDKRNPICDACSHRGKHPHSGSFCSTAHDFCPACIPWKGKAKRKARPAKNAELLRLRRQMRAVREIVRDFKKWNWMSSATFIEQAIRKAGQTRKGRKG